MLPGSEQTRRLPRLLVRIVWRESTSRSDCSVVCYDRNKDLLEPARNMHPGSQRTQITPAMYVLCLTLAGLLRWFGLLNLIENQ